MWSTGARTSPLLRTAGHSFPPAHLSLPCPALMGPEEPAQPSTSAEVNSFGWGSLCSFPGIVLLPGALRVTCCISFSGKLSPEGLPHYFLSFFPPPPPPPTHTLTLTSILAQWRLLTSAPDLWSNVEFRFQTWSSLNLIASGCFY